MDRNRNHLNSTRQIRSQGRGRGHLTDDQLEALAVAFGSHLIRNAPPHPNPCALLNRNIKITAE
ncbi:MAG TPA: hypothetical protein VH105_06015 [Burkholderiales bacterium]|jgi:hypothetical protein|nr:hypothetical protein [Burkholderiales bacterium]